MPAASSRPVARPEPSDSELSLRRTVSELRDQIAHLQQHLARAEAERVDDLEKHQDSLDQLRRALAEAERKITDQDVLAVEVERQQVTQAELRRQLADAQRKLADRDQAISDAQERLAEHEEKVSSHARIVADKERAIAELERVIDDLRQAMADRDRFLADRERVLADTDRALTERVQTAAGLQRAVDERDRALADKDEELSAEIEKRLTLSAAHLDLIAEHRVLGMKVDELTQQIATAEARIHELSTLIEATEAQWTGERAVIEAQYGETLARLDTEKRQALDQAEEALNATAMRLKQAHDEDKHHFETSIGALKSELELKDTEARGLATERKQLADQLAVLRTDTLRAVTKLEEQNRADKAALAQMHAAEQTRITEQHTAAIAGVRDQHAAELARVGEQHQVELARLRDQSAVVAFELEEARRAIDNAKAATEQSNAEKRALEHQLLASEREAAVTRGRFVAHLEAGLALFGGTTASPDKPERAADDGPTGPQDVTRPPRD
jgi:chromosome segregation ATPase